MSKKTLRVALVMGGGVSLGAFSGGALAETIRQLYELRQQGRYADVVLDVFSGASAGGITLALLLRALANPDGKDIEAVVDEVERLERLLWVTETGILSMLPGRKSQPSAILSRSRLERLVVKEPGLCWEDGTPPNPCSLLANRVCFGISLMNYNGLHVQGTEEPSLQDAKSTTLYGDYRYFCLDLGEPPKADKMKLSKHYDREAMSGTDAWLDLYATAIAGGAFPIAFEPVVLLRDKDEFPSRTWPQELGKGPFPFTYGDGGAFNNEPLKEAMRMIGYQDGYELNKPWRVECEQIVRVETEEFERILIYIDPDLAGSSSELTLSLHASPEPTDRIVASGARLVTAIRGQAAVKDVLSSDQVESRLQWRHELRRLLLDAVDQIPPPASADLGAETALQEILAAKETASQNSYRHINEIERVYWEEHQAEAIPYSQMSTEERERYSLLALVDQVADLRAKNQVRVIAIAPARPSREERERYAKAIEQMRAARARLKSQTEIASGDEPGPARARPFERIRLAGAFLGSFGGFLEQEYRDNDFQIGQLKALTVLEQVLNDSEQGTPLQGTDAESQLAAVDEDHPLVQPAELHQHTNAAEINRRLQQLTYLFLQSMASWPLRQLTRIVLWVANRWIVKWLARKLEPAYAEQSQSARLRIQITDLPPGQHRLYLANARTGKHSPPIEAGADRCVVLETGISFTQDQVRGRYVFQKRNAPGRWWTRVVLRRSLLGRTARDLLLQQPQDLWEPEPTPRPLRLEQTSWSWSKRAAAAEITQLEWETAETLADHTETLKSLADASTQ